MSLSSHLSNHLHQVYFGGNWTVSNLKDQLEDVSLKEASIQIDGCNSILALTYHIGYYVNAILGVLEGKSLEAKDKFSFDHPVINSETEWFDFKTKKFEEVENLVFLIQQLPDSKLDDYFTDEKYGSYYRNLLGLIEHSHYHLGQVAILKKLVRKENNS